MEEEGLSPIFLEINGEVAMIFGFEEHHTVKEESFRVINYLKS